MEAKEEEHLDGDEQEAAQVVKEWGSGWGRATRTVPPRMAGEVQLRKVEAAQRSEDAAAASSAKEATGKPPLPRQPPPGWGLGWLTGSDGKLKENWEQRFMDSLSPVGRSALDRGMRKAIDDHELREEQQRGAQPSMASQARGLGPVARNILQRAKALAQAEEQEARTATENKEPLPSPGPRKKSPRRSE